MIEIKVDDERNSYSKYIGFLTAEDKERQLYLHCKIFIYADGSFTLEKFMGGNVGKYEFQCDCWERDTLFFKGRGRGRKPESAEIELRNFIKEVQQVTGDKTIKDFN